MARDLTKVTKQQFKDALGLSEHAAGQLAAGTKKLNPESLATLEKYLGGEVAAVKRPKEKADDIVQSPVRASSIEKESDSSEPGTVTPFLR